MIAAKGLPDLVKLISSGLHGGNPEFAVLPVDGDPLGYSFAQVIQLTTQRLSSVQDFVSPQVTGLVVAQLSQQADILEISERVQRAIEPIAAGTAIICGWPRAHSIGTAPASEATRVRAQPASIAVTAASPPRRRVGRAPSAASRTTVATARIIDQNENLGATDSLLIGTSAAVHTPAPGSQPGELLAKADAGAQLIIAQICHDPIVARRYMEFLVEHKLMRRLSVVVSVAVPVSVEAAKWLVENRRGTVRSGRLKAGSMSMESLNKQRMGGRRL